MVLLQRDAPEPPIASTLSDELRKLGYIGLCRLGEVGASPDELVAALERFAAGRLVRTDREFLRQDPKLRPDML